MVIKGLRSIKIYVVSPKRNRTFETALRWTGAGSLWRWCCVAGTLSFIFTLPHRATSIIHRVTRAWVNVCLVPSAIFASWIMKDLEELHVCVNFCFKLEKTFTETFQMSQQAYGKDCLSRTQCYEWYQRFKSGRNSIEDDPKSGRPSS